MESLTRAPMPDPKLPSLSWLALSFPLGVLLLGALWKSGI
ncbi:hypothetical protein HMPREF9577_00532 [Cutibacterium acnes HL110PA3]|nr:hypothetical protein HMPREF9577_00532 [Cutibacterium acnes HL110PA3]EFT77014.1 hypothetical protein HMPREF9599_01741 [Cutibacterium acnes HL050PA2]